MSMRLSDFTVNILNHFIDDAPERVSSINSTQLAPDDRVYLVVSSDGGYIVYETDYISPRDMPWVGGILFNIASDNGYKVVNFLQPKGAEDWDSMPLVFTSELSNNHYLVAHIVKHAAK